MPIGNKSKLFILFILVAFLSQGVILFISRSEEQAINIPDEQDRSQKKITGIIESINYTENFLIISSSWSNYAGRKEFKNKIYFDNNTIIIKKGVLQKDNVVYFEAKASPSTIEKLKENSKVAIVYISLYEANKFYAKQITYGSPFPEI